MPATEPQGSVGRIAHDTESYQLYVRKRSRYNLLFPPFRVIYTHAERHRDNENGGTKP
nr:MAG TPA: hypothetical protein [Caudoviricetes sp.]